VPIEGRHFFFEGRIEESVESDGFNISDSDTLNAELLLKPLDDGHESVIIVDMIMAINVSY
jgi:hypothetical protein